MQAEGKTPEELPRKKCLFREAETESTDEGKLAQVYWEFSPVVLALTENDTYVVFSVKRKYGSRHSIDSRTLPCIYPCMKLPERPECRTVIDISIVNQIP